MASKCTYDPKDTADQPLGQYHCPICGEMCVAGMEHPDYSLLEEPAPVTPFCPDCQAQIDRAEVAFAKDGTRGTVPAEPRSCCVYYARGRADERRELGDELREWFDAEIATADALGLHRPGWIEALLAKLAELENE